MDFDLEKIKPFSSISDQSNSTEQKKVNYI